MSASCFIAPELNEYVIRDFLIEHLRSVGLLQQGAAGLDLPVLEIPSNADFWRAILKSSLRHGRVRLPGFQVTDWFPRSPGLYHTDGASNQRKVAQRHVHEENGIRFFEPYGKMNMIEGGLGSVRFKPIRIDEAECYLGTATSDGFCHSGIPLAIPFQIAREYGFDSDRKFTITGQLRYLPEFLESKFQHWTRIPQLYVYVDRLEAVMDGSDPVLITPMVFFESTTTGLEKTRNVTYATCPHNQLSEIDRTADWISWYVDRYRGEIVTNFDQQRPTFEGAQFSLQNVFAGRIRRDSLAQFGLAGDELAGAVVNIIRDSAVAIGTVGNVNQAVGGSAIAAGKSSSATVDAQRPPSTNIAARKSGYLPAWIFGGLLLVFLMGVVVWNPHDLQPTQQKIVKLLAALCGGLISAFFTGSLKLGGKIPKMSNLTIGAVGGFAAFVVVYLLWD